MDVGAGLLRVTAPSAARGFALFSRNETREAASGVQGDSTCVCYFTPKFFPVTDCPLASVNV